MDETDYATTIAAVIDAAAQGRGLSVTALAVHGLMTAHGDREYRYCLNHLDLVVPDGQPLRWGLNLQYGSALGDRVYGPKLMLLLCGAAQRHGLPVFFYGSTMPVLEALSRRMSQRFPALKIAGVECSKFRQISRLERAGIVERIRASGAKITFVGLGCPRQEVFAFECRDLLQMPVLAVGAAFDYNAGLLDQPSDWIQDRGLQWLYRLCQDPLRLWRRYLLLNPKFMMLLALQVLKIHSPDPGHSIRPASEARYG